MSEVEAIDVIILATNKSSIEPRNNNDNSSTNIRMDPMDIQDLSEADMARFETTGNSKPPESNNKTTKTVYIRCVFVKIGDIDTVRECFEASIYIEVMWRDPNGDIRWYPDLYVDNALGELKQKKSREMTKEENGDTIFIEKHSFKGKFFERMELWHFPFDTQDITITICSQLSEKEVFLEAMADKPSQVFTSTFTDEQEWVLHTHVDTNTISVISDCQIGPRQRPALQFSTRATRRSMFYIVNIWFVSFLLCMLAIAVFGIPRTMLQGRLQLSFILMLTTVTFKFVIANHIPRISYLTILDESILLNLLFLVSLSIYHTIASVFAADHPIQDQEKYVIIVFAFVYVAANVAIAIQVLCGAYKRQKLMNEKDEIHKQKLKSVVDIDILDLKPNGGIESVFIAPEAQFDEMSNL